MASKVDLIKSCELEYNNYIDNIDDSYQSNYIIKNILINKDKINLNPELINKNINQLDIINVNQRCYSIMNKKDNKLIGTYGLGPCFSICMSDKNKIMLAHIDALTNNPLDIFINKFTYSNDINVYLFGGEKTLLCIEIMIDIIKKLPDNFNIKYVNLFDNNVKNFSISSNEDIFINICESNFCDYYCNLDIEDILTKSHLHYCKIQF